MHNAQGSRLECWLNANLICLFFFSFSSFDRQKELMVAYWECIEHHMDIVDIAALF